MNGTSAIQVSVIEPVGKALEKTKQILFSPFEWSKWFTIGFCAWLAFLGEGGGSGGSNGGRHGGSPDFGHIRHSIESNLYWIIPVGIVVGFIVIAICLVLLWLRSRGKFMFLYCVAKNKATVVYPWTEYAREANSLFLFKIVLWLISMVCIIPLVVGWIVVIIPIARAERFLPAMIGIIAVLTLITLLVAIVFSIILKFTEDFVVPVMFIHRIRCMDAWKRVWELVKNNSGRFVLFILFAIVLSLAIGTILVAAAIATCCCACCLMMLPYLGTVLLLPILVF
ncbi:MAG: hypothetical protein FJ263_07940 [Planctomycetes bacterium]|nr:hypothetical protein [Planctomycetota bacterium]